MSDNGEQTSDAAEDVRKMREAVRDVPEPERKPVTRETVKTLRKAGLTELAKIAEPYASPRD